MSANHPVRAVPDHSGGLCKLPVGYRPVADIPSSSQMSELGISRDQERNCKAVGASEHRKLAAPSDSGWLSAERDVLGAGHGKLFADARCLVVQLCRRSRTRIDFGLVKRPLAAFGVLGNAALLLWGERLLAVFSA